MFRKMRRYRQQLEHEECEQILRRSECGVLGVIGDNGYPYTVPVNGVYYDSKIAFHCATEGHKLDAIRACDRVSYCVISEDTLVPEERATAYVSVIAFGRARITMDETEMREVCRQIGQRFCPDYIDACMQETDEAIQAGRLACVIIDIEHLTGKCGSPVLRSGKRLTDDRKE